MSLKTIRIHEDVFNEISEYCKLNDIKIVDFCSEKLKEAVLIEKYGDTPFGTMISKKQNDTTTEKTEKIEKKPIVIEPSIKPVEKTIEEPVVVEEKPVVRKRRL